MMDEDNASAATSDFDQSVGGNGVPHSTTNFNFDYDTSMDQGQGFDDLL
jgi:hypothetical protein